MGMTSGSSELSELEALDFGVSSGFCVSDEIVRNRILENRLVAMRRAIN
jgi:hypothetical protein